MSALISVAQPALEWFCDSIRLASLCHFHEKLLCISWANAVVVLCEGFFVFCLFFPSGCALFISVLG